MSEVEHQHESVLQDADAQHAAALDAAVSALRLEAELAIEAERQVAASAQAELVRPAVGSSAN